MSSLEQFGYTQELKRALTTRDLVVYGMIFMVPIAPFGVFGFVWNDAKGMVPLAYLLGLLGMFFTAMSYASMSRAFPVAGSVYSYVQHGLHEVAGFFSGWLILLDYILVPALLYIFSAVALRPLLPRVPDWIWLVAFVSFNAVVNLLGVQLSALVNRYMLGIELATVALFIVLGLGALYGGQGAGGLTLKPVYDPAVFSIATVAGATSIAVLSFLGFDGISTLAEESRGGQGAVGRATLLALLLVGLLFIVQTWIATDLARGMRFSAPETAFYEVAERAGGIWLRDVTLIVIVIASGIANAMAAQAAVSRILFAMARDRKLPAVLASVHPRYQTPYVSTLVVAAISLIVGLLLHEACRRPDSHRQFRCAHGIPAAAPVGHQPLFHPRAQRRLAASPADAARRPARHRLRAVRDGQRRQDDGRVLDSRRYRLFRRAYLRAQEAGRALMDWTGDSTSRAISST